MSKRFPIPKQRESRLFNDITVYMPPETKRLLKEHSERIGLPMARLAAIAIDNELDQSDPFNYPCTLPTSIYIEGAYTDEGGKILRYLGKLREGASRDQLMLARRTIGILSREDFMLGYRELLEQGMIEEVPPKPKGESYRFKFRDDYRIAVIADKDRKALASTKRAEAERLLKEAKELEG